MNHRTAPQYRGSPDDLEKKKVFLFVAALILMGIVYVLVSPLLENAKLLAFCIIVPSWIAIFVFHNSIDKWIKNDYSEKRRVWCDFWESYHEELKQKKREYDTLPDGDEKLELKYEIAQMEKYWHQFDNYA